MQVLQVSYSLVFGFHIHLVDWKWWITTWVQCYHSLVFHKILGFINTKHHSLGFLYYNLGCLFLYSGNTAWVDAITWWISPNLPLQYSNALSKSLILGPRSRISNCWILGLQGITDAKLKLGCRWGRDLKTNFCLDGDLNLQSSALTTRTPCTTYTDPRKPGHWPLCGQEVHPVLPVEIRSPVTALCVDQLSVG